MSADVAPPDAETASAHSHFAAGGIRALLATICWSSSALLIDRITVRYHLTALEISAWRVLLVLPILAVFIGGFRRRSITFELNARSLHWYLLAGLGITAGQVTWAASVQLNGPAAASALAFSAPALIAVGERVLFRVPIRWIQAVAIAVNLIGCSFAAGVRGPAQIAHDPVAVAVGLSNGLAFSLYTLLVRERSPRGSRDPLVTLLGVFIVAELELLLWALPFEGVGLFRLHLDARGWILLLGVAVGPTLLAYAFFNSSLRVLPATFASLITTLEPPMVAVAAFVLFGRSIAGIQWLGIVLIVLAVTVVQLSATRTRRPPASGGS
ncbi:MAG TPA: EamA family transporter [Chloroflexota bacterium]|nr:EamA family transporter [Chloroflexota bacterium]